MEDLDRLVIAPSAEYLSVFEFIKKYITKRAHKLLDYDRHRNAVKNLKDKKDKTAGDEKKLSQMEYALDAATREYNNYNNLLKNELPIFIELRVEFINPIFQTFFSVQSKVFSILYSEFRRYCDGNLDMTCSATNGYALKADQAVDLLAALTLPRRKVKSDSEPFPSSATDSKVGSMASSHPSPTDVSPTSSLGGKSNPVSVGVAAAAAAAVKPPVVPPTLPKGKKYVIALYDFDAQAEGDLIFRKNR